MYVPVQTTLKFATDWFAFDLYCELKCWVVLLPQGSWETLCLQGEPQPTCPYNRLYIDVIIICNSVCEKILLMRNQQRVPIIIEGVRRPKRKRIGIGILLRLCFPTVWALPGRSNHWEPLNTRIICATHTCLLLPNVIQPKPFSLPCTLNLFLSSLIDRSLVCASSIFLQPLTPSTTTYYSTDCLPGLVLLTLFSSGFSSISLLALSPFLALSPHHPNHNHSLVVFHKVQFLDPPVHPLHYFTQFTHQSILSWPSLIRRWPVAWQ